MEVCIEGANFASLRVKNDVKKSLPFFGHTCARGIWVNPNSAVVTICTVPPGLTFHNSTFCPYSVFMCFVWISEQTTIISLYNIN
jgi:hypothetical protein